MKIKFKSNYIVMSWSQA